MSELNKDDSSSDGGSKPSLQEGEQSDWSSNDDTDSYGDDDMFDDGEWWGYKEQTLKQIISSTNDGMFLAIDTLICMHSVCTGMQKFLLQISEEHSFQSIGQLIPKQRWIIYSTMELRIFVRPGIDFIFLPA